MIPLRLLLGLLTTLILTSPAVLRAAETSPTDVRPFLEKHCFECHDAETAKGGLDLTSLKLDLNDAQTFAKWVKVHDQVSSGTMPPKKKPRPAAGELTTFTHTLAGSLAAADEARAVAQGRSTQRRLNRYEYENAVRDLLHAPWLQIRDALPEDGEASRFNKIGDSLDVSHVQMARYMNVADYALHQVVATQVEQPKTETDRYYTREI